MKKARGKFSYVGSVIVLLMGLLTITGTLWCAPATKYVVIGTHEPGSSYYVWGSAIADIITKYTPLTGKIMAVAGSGAFLPMTETGEVQMGMDSFYGAWQALHGKEPYPKAFNIRAVLVGSGISVGLYVRKDSVIQTRAEIKGKRIGSGYGGAPNIHAYAEAEIANAGLTWKDVVPVPRASLYEGQREDVTEKRLDVFYASVGSAITVEMHSALGIRFLPLDPSPGAMERMRKGYPAVIKQVQPGPPGIDKPMWLTFLPNYLHAHVSLSEDVVYNVVKAMWEHNDEFRAKEKRLGDWKKEQFASDQAVIPYHPGAIKFYREKGVWTNAMEQMQRRLLAEIK